MKKSIKHILSIVLLFVLFFLCFVIVSHIQFWETKHSYLDAIRLKVHKEYVCLFHDGISPANKERNSFVENLNFPIFQLQLSKNDIKYFENLFKLYETDFNGVDYSKKGIELYQKNKKWRKANLDYNGVNYSVKIIAHGRQPHGHRIGRFISFSIKLLNGEKINDVSRFKLIIYDRINNVYHKIKYLSEKFDLLLIPQDNLVKVKINDWSEKLYVFEYPANDYGLGLIIDTSMKIFSHKIANDKSMVCAMSKFDARNFATKFYKAAEEKGMSDTVIEKIYKRYFDLNHLISSNKYEEIINYFDINYISSYMAARMIGGFSGHECYLGNTYVLFNMNDCNFYPAINREPEFIELDEKIAIEKQLAYYRHPVKNNINRKLLLYQTLAQNDLIRQETYRKLYSFIKNNSDITRAKVDEIEDFHSELYHFDILYSLLVKPLFKKDVLLPNMRIIKEYLETSNPEIKNKVQDNILTVDISPNSMSVINISSFNIMVSNMDIDRVIAFNCKILLKREGRVSSLAEMNINEYCTNNCIDVLEHFKDFYLFNGLDDCSEEVKSTYVFQFNFGNESIKISDIEVDFINNITKQKI